MKRKTGILVLALILVAVIGLAGWGIQYYQDGKDVVRSRVYSGRFYLDGAEYTEFKKYLADNPEVAILELDALSSPNALIHMRLSAPADIIVPYGSEVTTYYETTLFDLAFTIVLALLALLVAAIFLVPKIDWGNEYH